MRGVGGDVRADRYWLLAAHYTANSSVHKTYKTSNHAAARGVGGSTDLDNWRKYSKRYT